MEEKPDKLGISSSSEDFVSGKSDSGDVIDRIKVLNEALSIAKKEISLSRDEAYSTLSWLMFFAALSLFFAIILGYKLLHSTIPENWSWQIIFFSCVRLIIVTSGFYVISYLFRLIKTYLHLHQRNTHRLMVIGSMASLVESANENERNKIYDKVLDIIINFDKTGMLKETEHKNELIIELIKKIPLDKLSR